VILRGKSAFFFKIAKCYVFGIVVLKELHFKKRKKSRFKFAPHGSFFINALFITQKITVISLDPQYPKCPQIF
jgi:hypothetical protein